MKEDLPHNEECVERVAGNDMPNNRVWFDVEPERNVAADINANFVLNIVFQNRREAAEQARDENRGENLNETANNNDHQAVEDREEEEEPRDFEENDHDGDGRGRVPDNN
ncbi:hypothetical protein CRE_30451 [Caenorhabditis remanei]|nr:hypothetical protein CRE_30451 [Caenorhabditis remanei]